MKQVLLWAIATFIMGLALCLAWAAAMWFMFVLLRMIGIL